jgi:Tol biopolymer transport system component
MTLTCKLRWLTLFATSLAVCGSALAETWKEVVEQQVTNAPHGHMLTNTGVWSPDSQWIVYDVRSDAAGDLFDGTKIERVHAETKEVQQLYRSQDGACCGVVTYSRNENKVVFIHGPERPDGDWQYSAFHRRGVVVQTARPGTATNLDARDLSTPFTPGALRGGTHVHTFSGDGSWIAFTYEDHVLATSGSDSQDVDRNQRNIGVSVPSRPVKVSRMHPRNHDGSHFSVLVTRTVNEPRSGSDEISRAYSDAWVGRNGYVRPDGTRQRRAIAFQGHVRTDDGETISEVFVVDIPDGVTKSNDNERLEGSNTLRPRPPHGTTQRRLTFTSDRKFPGIQGVRHWLRSSPDGSQIAFLMRDEVGIAQLWTISPNGGALRKVTNNRDDVSSAFSWSPDGRFIAHTMSESVCLTSVESGKTISLTQSAPGMPLRSEACVFSPDGQKIAYVRRISNGKQTWNQIFTLRRGE